MWPYNDDSYHAIVANLVMRMQIKLQLWYDTFMEEYTIHDLSFS